MERKRKMEKKLIERKKLLRLKRQTKIKGNNEVPVDLKSYLAFRTGTNCSRKIRKIEP